MEKYEKPVMEVELFDETELEILTEDPTSGDPLYTLDDTTKKQNGRFSTRL